jgi:hypothetical protein
LEEAHGKFYPTAAPEVDQNEEDPNEKDSDDNDRHLNIIEQKVKKWTDEG